MSKNYDNSADKKFKKTYEETINLSSSILKEKDCVLDFACGTGITTIEIAKKVKSVIAIDISLTRVLTNLELQGKFNSFNFSIIKTKKISEYSADYFISAVKQH